MNSLLGDQTIHFAAGDGRSLPELLRTVEPGTLVELSPGRFSGPLEITRPVILRGAGDLTRIFVERGQGPVITLNRAEGGVVRLLSLALEGGDGDLGGGLSVVESKVELENLHIERCRARRGGGLFISSGEVLATRIRIEQVEAERGGAICAQETARLQLTDGQFTKTQARFGGAVAVEDAARVLLERVTISEARATTSVGGQAIYVSGSNVGSPVLRLKRVRLTDSPLWSPLVHDRLRPGEVFVEGCDLPRLARLGTGLVEEGGNTWR